MAKCAVCGASISVLRIVERKDVQDRIICEDCSRKEDEKRLGELRDKIGEKKVEEDIRRIMDTYLSGRGLSSEKRREEAIRILIKERMKAKHSSSSGTILFVCGLGLVILLVGLGLTTVQLPQPVIAEAEKYYRDILREYGAGTQASRQAFQALEAVRNARPYSVAGIITALIGFVTIVMGVAMRCVSKQTSEMHVHSQQPIEKPVQRTRLPRFCPDCGRSLELLPMDIASCPYCGERLVIAPYGDNDIK